MTNQKAKKYLSEERGKLESTGLLACLCCVNQKIFCMSLLKTVLPFLTNQAAQFISCGIGRSYFSQIYFYHWFYGMISRFKSNSGEGVHFYLCLALSLLTIGGSNLF